MRQSFRLIATAAVLTAVTGLAACGDGAEKKQAAAPAAPATPPPPPGSVHQEKLAQNAQASIEAQMEAQMQAQQAQTAAPAAKH